MERGEGGSFLLHLSLGGQHLSCHLLVGVELQLHVIFQFGQPAARALQDDVLVGVGKLGVKAAGPVVAGLGLALNLLVVLQVYAHLRRAVVGNEFLKSRLDRIGHGGANDGILVGDLYGDDHGLLVNVADDAVVQSLDHGSLLAGQPEGVE